MKFGGLIGRKRNPMIAPERKRKCMLRSRAVLAIAIVASFAPQAVAQARAKTDPDWPCQQIKTPTFSLASVWAGPQLDLDSQSWRNESDVADLEAQMAQRRVPIADVEAAIADFKAKAGPDARRQAFARLRRGVCGFVAATLPDHRRPGSNWPQAERARRSHSRGERGRAKVFGPEAVTARRRPARTVKNGCYGTSASSMIAVRPSLTSARRRR